MRDRLAVSRTELICWGTEGSNPSPSSGESIANLTWSIRANAIEPGGSRLPLRATHPKSRSGRHGTSCRFSDSRAAKFASAPIKPIRRLAGAAHCAVSPGRSASRRPIMPRVRGRPPNKLGKSASASASSPVGGERFASRSRRVLSSGEGKKSSLISWQSGTCCRLVIKSLQPSPRGRLSTRPGRSRSRRGRVLEIVEDEERIGAARNASDQSVRLGPLARIDRFRASGRLVGIFGLSFQKAICPVGPA